MTFSDTYKEHYRVNLKIILKEAISDLKPLVKQSTYEHKDLILELKDVVHRLEMYMELNK